MSTIETYIKLNPKSMSLYKRASKSLPSGCTRNVLYTPPFPIYMSRGNGSRLYDVDGNERIDFNYNNTTLILGHNHPKVLRAAREQLERGTVLGAPTEQEIELAEEITQRLGTELLRFTPSGTEANIQAIRLARSHMGREKIAKCEGAYHGSWDTVDISVAPPLDKAGPSKAPTAVPQNEGVPKGVLENTIIIPFNDSKAAEKIIKRHRDELAAVILEPMQRDMPPKLEFLKTLREVTEKCGILLIFDEVISFRLSPGGAQGYYGVKPDITTLGKIIGGGFPVGAYTSTEEVMKPLIIPSSEYPVVKQARLGFSGTFNAHPITMAAGLAALKELKPEVYVKMDQTAEAMRKGILSLLKERRLGYQVSGVGSFFHIEWTKEEVVDYRSAATEDRVKSRVFSTDLMNRGVFIWGHPNVSAATTSGDVKNALEAISRSLDSLTP
jgi:glutamate-1-semialdehyde 2,1-aminomutase